MHLSKKFREAAVFSLLVLESVRRRKRIYSPKNDNLSLSQRISSIQATAPLPRTHSHNDYVQAVPLFDALNNGFSSVEADFFLVKGQLLVGHTPLDLSSDRTLEGLYLKPLLELTQRNQGHVYPGSGESLQLMIEIKYGEDKEKAYKALNETLKRYASMLTTYQNGKKIEGAVTIVLIGYRPSEAAIKSEVVRYVAFDGNVSELKKGMDPNVIPLISGDGNFSWTGTGPMPKHERWRLKDIVDTAHANGQKVRFWINPEDPPARREAVWKELLNAGVDYIHTDYLPELRAWLLKNDTPPSNNPAAKKPPSPHP